ncbi:hypothetical protein [Streptomyces sp. NBRC 110611]|uniref:LppU/SCO3897 family protein n=1 Tax=Streptomyces sp. NBRC 110611 TaxID=1621259 RepID=UPI000834DF26|nr:hypothetical protein [Streptomyces sp. NBRC 110611]
MFTPTGVPARRPWLRPLIAFGAVAVAFTGFWVLTVLTDDGKPPAKDAREANAGECLENRGTQAKPVLFTIGCNDAKAEYMIATKPGYQGTCAPEFDVYEEKRNRLKYTVCLRPLRH